MLLVGENTGVKVGLEGVSLLAVRTVGWFEDATHLHGALLFAEALHASEMSLLHLRNDVTVADDDAPQRDQFFDVAGAKLTDTEDSAQVVWSHLDDLVVEFVVTHELVSIVLGLTTDVVHIELLVDLGHHEIENGNDIRRVVLNLAVKHLIILKDMVTVDVQHISVEFAHFLQFLDVVRGFLELLVVVVIVVVLDLFKVVDEVFEFHLNIAGVDVGAPEDLGVRAHLIIGAISQSVLIEHSR